MNESNLDLLEKMRERLHKDFPLGLIPRKIIKPATGGLLHHRTEANNDCSGKGIADPVIVGRQVCYRVDNVIDYLQKKMS